MTEIKALIPEDNEGNFLREGDFNVRIGKEGTLVWRDDRDEIGRKLRDKTLNIEGKKFLEERGWDILNGNIIGKREFTYIGARGNSVIDYTLGNKRKADEMRSW
ncbi:hypothetical protein P5V15_002463 [Pogonomyrmex californicus]